MSCHIKQGKKERVDLKNRGKKCIAFWFFNGNSVNFYGGFCKGNCKGKLDYYENVHLSQKCKGIGIYGRKKFFK